MKVSAIRIYYEVHGQGEPLLRIMGLGDVPSTGRWVLPELQAEHYQVVIFDNRGAGRSDQPPGGDLRGS